MATTSSTSLLSGRAQDRLSQLQRALSSEIRGLVTQQSLLFGALQACDHATQIELLYEYVGRIEAIVTAAGRLHEFILRQAEPLAEKSMGDNASVPS